MNLRALLWLLVAPAAGAIDLDAITVTGTRTDQRLADSPVATEIIDADQIRATASRDVREVLQAYGLIGDASASHGDQTFLDGLGGSRVLYLIDGRKVVGRTAQNLDGASVPLTNVDRIEVVRGPQSVLYGSDAMGGVVNIITKAPRPQLGGSLIVENTSLPAYDDPKTASGPQMTPAYFQAQRLDGSVDVPWGDVRTTVSGTGSRSGFYWNETGEASILPRSWLGRLAADSTLNTPEGHRWTWGLSGTTRREDNQTDVTGTLDRRDLSRGEAYGTWKFPVESGSLEFRLSNQAYGTQSVTLRQGTSPTDSTTGFDDRTETSVWYQRDLSDQNFLTLGLESSWDVIQGANLSLPGGTLIEDRQALVVQDTHIEDGASAAGGVRIERQSTFGWYAAPKVSGMVSPLPGLRFLGGVGLGYRAPSAEDRYYRIDWSWHPIVLGNSSLRPESSWAANADVEWTTLTWLTTRLHTFHQELFDEIVAVSTGTAADGRTIFQNQNRQRSARTGAETEVGLWWNRAVGVETAYQLLGAWDRTNGQVLVDQPVHTWRLGATLGDPAVGYRFRVDLRTDSLRKAPVLGAGASWAWGLHAEGFVRAENLTGVIDPDRGPFAPATVRLGVRLST